MKKDVKYQVTKKGSPLFVETETVDDAIGMAMDHADNYKYAYMEVYEVKNGRKYFVIGYSHATGFYR